VSPLGHEEWSIVARKAIAALILLATLVLADRGALGEAAASPPAAAATTSAPAEEGSFAQAICLALARNALENGLPVDFLTRLIWQESRFDPNARSHAGAEGIAQFMPATARERGLADPFDPLVALRESARFLRDLRAQFGNLGLAAAAYNAGPGRVQAWLGGRSALPGETRHYVRVITGRPAEDWIGALDEPEHRRGNAISCTAVARLLTPGLRAAAAPQGAVPGAAAPPPPPPPPPWVLHLAGNSSQPRALADFRALQRRFPAVLGDREPLIVRGRLAGLPSWFLVRLGEPTRERAKALCARLEAAGGSCLVLRN
jgi:hypothetical protein